MTTTMSDLLALVRSNESGGNYSIPPWDNYAYPSSHASGAYQFEPATWQQLTQEAGIGTQYPEAYLAPAAIQDAVAAYAASHYDPNSAFLWQASAPAGGYPTVDAGTPPSGGGGGSMSGGLTITQSAPPDFGQSLFYPAGGAPSAFGLDSSSGLPLWTMGAAGAVGAPPPGGPGSAAASSCSVFNPACWWSSLISWLTSIGADLALGFIAIIAIGGLLLLGADRASRIAPA